MIRSRTFTPTHVVLSAAALSLILVAGFWSTQSESSTSIQLPSNEALIHFADLAQQPGSQTTGQPLPSGAAGPAGATNIIEHRVQPGDSLSSIFSQAEASQADLNRILKADVEYLALETLRPGTELKLKFNEQGEFQQLALDLDPARSITYTRVDSDTFEYQESVQNTHWVSEVLKGSIHGSFYQSARNAGLSATQIASVQQLLEHQINFRRELRAGDTFAVIVGHETTATETTGKTRIEAVSLERRNRTHTAFLFDDGNYYDQNGKSVLPAFRRLPTAKSFRVSSHFNPNRLHPITGRISPHNGVDLATPVGTPIMSTGDGVVERVGNHPYAGKYVDINHGNAYKTRYLHLDKVFVRKGQQVRRGEKVAHSGNTGRSTGAHLHFELHINHKPVNPLKADIPTASDVPKTAFKQFEKLAEYRLAVMTDAASRSNLILAGIDTQFD
ncbi:peptidoglycan DD-metalloendopeptidase family protein [Marinobacter sp. 1_MG-2023]|uniref:peptidoglycan DD-metalloendopeptidase family protein n=1 Tax=Marinobacter sp. 1_MG-2023 TaxID=3062627 RepID=UPI0026E1569B|nr:peptidoglycan DD-metalloendopeptidase family protein [Marinobacter sp. 1_MG-2023]MDO6825004.1 peptidoglycan DD-metalloendopeptidase family protein [Marinobacter sp. 1_MG-2023]